MFKIYFCNSKKCLVGKGKAYTMDEIMFPNCHSPLKHYSEMNTVQKNSASQNCPRAKCCPL